MRNVIFSGALVVSFAIALTVGPVASFAAPPDGKGKPDKAQPHNSGNGGSVQHGSRDGGWDVDIIFGGRDRDIIRDYYRDHGRSCPPGLAKKRNGCLPPGQAKKRYRIGQRLPGDFQIYNIPDILRGRLSGLPDGYGYRQVDGDIAIIDLATRLVVDAVE